MDANVYEKRQSLLRKRMQQESLPLLLVTRLPNIRYLCGFSGSHALLLIGPEESWIISDGRYQEQIVQEVVGATFVLQGQRKETAALADHLAGLPSGELGFEMDHISVARHAALLEACPGRKLVGTAGWVEEMRAAKDQEEINLIREAVRIAETALERVMPEIREGMTERELAHRLEDLMWQAGAEKESFDTLVLFGARCSLPHGKPTDVKLVPGSPILMDFGCIHGGYCSDITRTVFLGEPVAEFREAYRAVQEAQQAAIEATRPNRPCREVDEVAREVLAKAGRGEQLVHGLGHGVGLEVHEAPRLSPTEDKSLCEHAVVTVEPGVYRPDWGGIRIENMVVVHPQGAEILNRSSTEMIIL